MSTPGVEADIAGTAALFADQTRARVLMALADRRALPASVLAAEAGVTAQAASAQLARLTSAGLLDVERSGRHRYYRLASPRAAALRGGRTCYDHLAGRLGVTVTQALIDRGALVPSDGIPDGRRRD